MPCGQASSDANAVATMTPPVLLILNGPPCAGKTHLYAFIQDEFVLPAMSKDILKESLFAALGWSDRDWSRRLSQAAMQLLYEFARSLLSQRQSCLIEANFVSHLAADRLAALGQALPFAAAQIFVTAQPAVLARRFQARARSGHRHPGHMDQVLQREYGVHSLPTDQLRPIPGPDPLLALDTTHMDAALAADHQHRVRAWLQGLGLPRRPRDAERGASAAVVKRQSAGTSA